MDPNRLLEDIIDTAQSINEESTASVSEAGRHLAEQIINLNNWIIEGGFLPSNWNRKETESD